MHGEELGVLNEGEPTLGSSSQPAQRGRRAHHAQASGQEPGGFPLGHGRAKSGLRGHAQLAGDAGKGWSKLRNTEVADAGSWGSAAGR